MHNRKRGNTNLDSNQRVQRPYGGLEGDEVRVLVGEDTEVARLDAETDTGGDVLL
jgi:hypothetical protein